MGRVSEEVFVSREGDVELASVISGGVEEVMLPSLFLKKDRLYAPRLSVWTVLPHGNSTGNVKTNRVIEMKRYRVSLLCQQREKVIITPWFTVHPILKQSVSHCT